MRRSISNKKYIPSILQILLLQYNFRMDMIIGSALFVTHIHKIFRLFQNKGLRFVEMDVRIQVCAALSVFGHRASFQVDSCL